MTLKNNQVDLKMNKNSPIKKLNQKLIAGLSRKWELDEKS